MKNVAITTATVTTTTKDIVVKEVLPHAPDAVWKALTTGTLMARWLMEPEGFEPAVGNRFIYRTRPAGEWDGTIECEVLTVIPNRRFAYSWTSGHPGNEGYGAPLNTLVTFELLPVPEGTHLRLTHSGFVLPRNEPAYTNMSGGWKTVIKTVEALASEVEPH